MSAEATCPTITPAIRPEDKKIVEVWCELEPLHLMPHHGHIFYNEEDGTVTSRCVEWGNEHGTISDSQAALPTP